MNLYLHLFEKEWHVWQALILLAGALGEPAPVTPETFQEKQIEPSALALDSPLARPLDTPAATVAALCRLPFTKDDLTALLQYLGLLDSAGNNLTASLVGRNRSLWGKFTAAYRVLKRQGLMEPTTKNAQWATAFKLAYQADLGPDVRSHSLTAQGRAAAGSPKDFSKGVEDASFWIIRWLEWRGTGKNRPLTPFNAL